MSFTQAERERLCALSLEIADRAGADARLYGIAEALHELAHSAPESVDGQRHGERQD